MNEYIDDFDYIDNSDQIVLSVHLEASFYFWDGHTPQIRKNLKDCITQYMMLFGEHITWGFDPIKDWRQKPFEKLPSFQTVLDKNSHPDDCIEWFVASDTVKDTAFPNHYNLHCLTARAWKIEDISGFYFRINRADFFDETKHQSILNFFDYCLEKLNPYHALMGWGSAFGYDKDDRDIDILNQAKSFYGINIYDVWDTVQLHHGMRTIDWYTYISDDLAQRIGGRKILTEQINQHHISHRDYSHGVLLIAGDTPDLLPIEEPISNEYIKINDICRPMRNGNFGSIGAGYDNGIGLQGFNTYFTDLWMRRFDNPKLWKAFPQPKPFIRSQPMILKTNEVCQVSGRYRYEDEYDYNRNQKVHVENENSRSNDYRQYVVLKQGDVAPYYLQMDNNGHIIKSVEVNWMLFEEL